MAASLREQARAIWDAAVAAVRPEELVPRALEKTALRAALAAAERVVVLGAGKAGAAMAAALERALADFPGRIDGLVNVPAETVRPLRWVKLHPARPAGANQPTAEGVRGARHILELARSAGPKDLGLCLLSGGGSALLPAPAGGISLEAKQQVTRLLHECGATINEMNAVRKHTSDIKGGRLAQAFSGRELYSLIISDVVGDPLDVIASGPTAPDPTTYADALAVLDRYDLGPRVAPEVIEHLKRGVAGQLAETPKTLPDIVHNMIIGNNALALAAAHAMARSLGYAVLDLGSCLEGETREVAAVMAGRVHSIRSQGAPLSPPVCLLSGGETTVTLGPEHGKGGRNQEFVLAVAATLARENALDGVAILSGGTDGEDGPTDAAGACADASTLQRAASHSLRPEPFLDRHDAYHFFQATGDLLKTGLTQTNVMDVRVILIR
jgi:hydroxypyruvate reductase/glycerate 2-kinase